MDPWYDLNGTPSHKLFPDPDKTGVEWLKAWREVMKKRHPNFIYGTNYNSSPVSRRLYPGYQEASAKNALVLFEDMNGYAREPYSTFEKWGKELTPLQNKKLKMMENQGYIIFDNNTVSLTPKGFLMENAIACEIML
jgi:coproporphyrinogen III oxidase-like Fe-S oxidoreductase